MSCKSGPPKAFADSPRYIVQREIRNEYWGDDRYGGTHDVKRFVAYYKHRSTFLWWTWYVYDQIGWPHEHKSDADDAVAKHNRDRLERKRIPYIVSTY